MANTTYLRRAVETYVRDQLAGEFRQSFSARFLTLQPGGRHEFDAVSDDRRVVASIKAASGLTASGRNPSGKIKDSIAELYYLSLVEAPIRRLILTTTDFFAIFARATVGAVAPGIDVVCVPLPREMQLEVDKVVLAASKEVSPDRAIVAVASEIESGLE
ncbi:MAG TPA: hypothetical protein VGQ89_16065 [Candidatus Limnocylindrales bacterium]|jgi:hypothetical protein|nr:hypothetical protein [Candidatus Limnocylindrales bacterium]